MEILWLQIYGEKINIPNRVNDKSIVFAQNNVKFSQEYLTDNNNNHHFLNTENDEQILS